MWAVLGRVGETVSKEVLNLAGLLKLAPAPGLVTLGFLITLSVLLVAFILTTFRRRSAIVWLRNIIAEAQDKATFSESIAMIDSKIDGENNSIIRRPLATAWQEYRETFVAPEENGATILRNSVRPSAFFNLDDLGFAPGFWRILPGLFVTLGLFCTFLGLIAALNSMDLAADKVQASLRDLLTIASAKFIMSLAGLFCSIVFTVALRWGTSRIEGAVHGLCMTIEKRLTFISLEDLAAEQLRAIREQQENFRKIGYELVAELGRPLREELPAAISSSISAAMGPLLDKVGQIGQDGMGTMVQDLSSRFSDDVGKALSKASESLVTAGDRIAQLSDRMDQSSGRVGIEIDSAVTRLAHAVDDLRAAMGATAQTASSALTQGAEQLLGVMNQTLEGIRDNTGEGARALSAAAIEMRRAAEGFRTEIDAAVVQGTTAARQNIESASADTAKAIGTAGISVLEAAERTSASLAERAEQVTAKAGSALLAPIDRIGEQLAGIVATLNDGASGMRRLSDGVRAGAEASEQAAGNFRTASQDLVAAASPIRISQERIETSVSKLSESTQNAALTIVRSSQASAQSGAQILAAAQEALGGHAQAIKVSLDGLRVLVERLEGQGDRLDDLDDKVGKAFDAYAAHVKTAVDGLFGHVRDMQQALSPALDTMQAIVEQAEQFAPESRRRA